MNASPRILVFQHIAIEHPGTFRDLMRAGGLDWTAVELDEGDKIPALDAFDILIVMGGPMDVWQEAEHPWLVAEKRAIHSWVAEQRKPFLGLCLGHQLLAEALGGTVAPAAQPEVGVMNVQLTPTGQSHPLWAGVQATLPVLQWHGAEVTRLPEDAQILASSEACRINAMSVGDCAFGMQFHVELTPDTVSEWGAVPEYEQSLEATMGAGALARMDAEASAQMNDFRNCAAQIYKNFMQLADTQLRQLA
jgi:GMP synthase-like glutamine amidotransferase